MPAQTSISGRNVPERSLNGLAWETGAIPSNQLSGGQQQGVSIARALMNGGDVHSGG